MLRKLKLYGELAKYVGHKEFEVEVKTIGQAVSFLIHNFEGIEAFMNPKYYQVKVGNYDINKDEINYPIGKEDLHFVPVISGSGGIGKVLSGAALIGLSLATGGFGGAAIGTFGLGAGSIGVGSLAIGIGASLMISGVSGMLFPVPDPEKYESAEDPRLSFSFSGVQNTSRAGTPVPIVYGEIFTGSVVISAGIDTNQVTG